MKIHALLRFHFRMDIRTWNEKKFTEEEIIQMWYEHVYVKKQLGEFKDE